MCRRGRPDRGGDDGAEDLPRSWFRDAGNVRARQPQRRARCRGRRRARPLLAPVPGLFLPGERRDRGPHPPPPEPTRQPAADIISGAEPRLGAAWHGITLRLTGLAVTGWRGLGYGRPEQNITTGCDRCPL